MHRSVYQTAEWRGLPRDYCIVSFLLDGAAGPCRGLIHHHHVNPSDPDSRTVQVCAAHHPRIHSVLRSLSSSSYRRCTHRHTSREAREACERKLNRL